MRRKGPDDGTLDQVRRDTADAMENFIETELVVIQTFFNVARDSYLRGNRRAGDRAKSKAMIGIQTVRLFTWTSDILSRTVKASFSRRCDQLERRVLGLQPK